MKNPSENELTNKWSRENLRCVKTEVSPLKTRLLSSEWFIFTPSVDPRSRGTFTSDKERIQDSRWLKKLYLKGLTIHDAWSGNHLDVFRTVNCNLRWRCTWRCSVTSSFSLKFYLGASCKCFSGWLHCESLYRGRTSPTFGIGFLPFRRVDPAGFLHVCVCVVDVVMALITAVAECTLC